MIFQSERTFQVWDYTVSHRQLLIRSPQSPNIETNIDIAFKHVDYTDLATLLEGVTITTPSGEDLARIGKTLGRAIDPKEVYCLVSGNRRFFVVAAFCTVLRNNLDIFDSSLDYIAETDPGRDRGEVLARSW